MNFENPTPNNENEAMQQNEASFDKSIETFGESFREWQKIDPNENTFLTNVPDTLTTQEKASVEATVRDAKKASA
jgi:hypothetical protein